MDRYPLSKEQEHKLIAMAIQFFTDNSHIYILGKEVFFKLKDSPRSNMPDSSMPWIEFVSTYLAEKVIYPKDDNAQRGIVDQFKDFYWNMNLYWWTNVIRHDEKSAGIHPVDYLYDLAVKRKLIKSK